MAFFSGDRWRAFFKVARWRALLSGPRWRAFFRWLGFSVIFALFPYGLTAAFQPKFDIVELLGDGSLNLLSLGLTVAAGVATLGDENKAGPRLLWFFFVGGLILLTVGSYAWVRVQLRSAGDTFFAQIPAPDTEILPNSSPYSTDDLEGKTDSFRPRAAVTVRSGVQCR